jgi:hypothetical protein
MQRRISYFDAEWNRKDKQGRIRVTFDDRSAEDLCPLSQEEMTLIVGLLRADKPMYYDAATETLSTLPKPVGKKSA